MKRTKNTSEEIGTSKRFKSSETIKDAFDSDSSYDFHDEMDSENDDDIDTAQNKVVANDSDDDKVELENTIQFNKYTTNNKEDSGYFEEEEGPDIAIEKFITNENIDKESGSESDVSAEDAWLEDYKNIDQNLKNQSKVQEDLLKQKKLNQRNRNHYLVDVALQKIKYFVLRDEIVLQSLSRLEHYRKQEINKSDDTVVKYITNGIEKLLDLIQLLEKKNIENVYQLDLNGVERLIDEEILDITTKVDNKKTKIWDFKWIKDKKEKNNGPYSNYEMQYWKDNYFQNKVIVKHHDDPDEEHNWIHISCLNFV